MQLHNRRHLLFAQPGEQSESAICLESDPRVREECDQFLFANCDNEADAT
jgi:hypothetical protein